MLDPRNVVFAAAKPDKGPFSFLPNENGELVFLTGPEALNEIQNLVENFTNNVAEIEPSERDIIPRPENWPVKDQGGSRGTCTAFAVTALSEMVNADLDASDLTIPLSEEYLYSKMRRELKDLSPENPQTGATFLTQGAVALKRFGVCSQEMLPYQGPKPEPAWSVSDPRRFDAAAALEKDRPHETCGLTFGLNENGRPEPLPDGLLNALLQLSCKPVSVTFPIYPEGDITPWTYGIGWDTGVIPEPAYDVFDHDTKDIGGHAICLIDFVEDADSPEGKGWFIFRNSWGETFGARPSENKVLAPHLKPGYGAISSAHIHKYCWELAFSLPFKF